MPSSSTVNGKLRTTVLIVAPSDVQAFAEPLMQQYAFDQWMRVPAHITLFYPFVPFIQLKTACETLRTLCASLPPFEVSLAGYARFPLVTYLQIVDPQPIRAIFDRLFAAFPKYPPYEGEFGTILHPHMTVGVFDTQAEQDEAQFPDYAPFTFTVDHLHVMTGYSHTLIPFVTFDVIPLNG